MDVLFWLVIISLIIGYLNLALILFREKPVINIYNKFPEQKKEDEEKVLLKRIFRDHPESTGEIPIESNVTIRSIEGEVNLDSEKMGSSNVSDLKDKIKKVRGK